MDENACLYLRCRLLNLNSEFKCFVEKLVEIFVGAEGDKQRRSAAHDANIVDCM